MVAASRAKRALDIVGAAVLLALFSPVIAVIALAILMTSGGPVLFRQVRPGLHGEPFTLHKFRTMRDPRPGEEPWTTDEIRTTRLGRFLRRTSLDELPELTLVLTGRMSLVGPRPLVMEYLPRYSAHHARRHECRPGITGLTQVSGRRSLTFGQRLDLDVSYLDNWSLWLDVKILFRTALEPFRRGEIVGQTPAEVDDIGLVPPVLERVR
ncbi:sugar transferase [Micromonospora echinospora]|uniref:Lipopolysaccharide/colanic/teichoic acid biosynthesis glycosyltransferase n=1 Tax=Micromonospora echinospora TaxID=1877 RepID=A0ABR6MEZ1_MICEC|nr:sugar transferase [Micromonospora echinospora]MBB5112912.1 lipopolysaccharide/colanic/teichoic acid biosynthesis glycosyltransferase [Micromonospora echinospora]